jgi:hypothetical protein
MGQTEIVLDRMEAAQKTLEEIVVRLDTVSAEVKSSSSEIQGFCRQMEDYGADLNGVKCKLLEGARVGVPSLVEVPLRGKGVLINNGAPLLGAAPPGTTSFPAGSSTFHTAPSSPLEQEVDKGRTSPEREDFRVRAPRHDFPRFSGNMPLMWIDRSLNYFEMFRIPIHQWVGMAMLYFEGHAALWYQAYHRRQPSITWEMLTVAIVDEFG